MSLKQALRHSMNGLAYAHEGELLPWEEKCRILGVEAPEPDPAGFSPPSARRVRERRQVALMVGQHLTGALLDYAAYSCRCLGAGLTLLTTAPLQAMELLLLPHLSRLKEEGITPGLAQVEAGTASSLAAYLSANREVIFVMVGSRQEEYRPLHETVRGKARWQLSVPLVVVDEESPRPAPPLPPPSSNPKKRSVKSHVRA